MTNTKTRVPFISGPYYKEMLRQMKAIGIVAAIVQAFYGLIGEFGAIESNGFIIGNSKHNTIYILYFFVAAILFIRNHISRGYIDVSGSLPLKKRTMFASHFAAVLTFAGIIFAANYIGVAIGELVRLIGKAGAYSIPDGFFASAKTLIEYLFAGIAIYGLMIMLSSVVNKVFSYLVALAVIANLPVLFISLASLYSDAPFTLGQIFFPVGTHGRQVLLFAALVVGALVALAAGYFAYANSRAETGNRPTRSPWIHIAIGVGMAACIGLFVFTVYRSARVIEINYKEAVSGSEALEGSKALITAIIVAAVLMVLAYTIYMWITLKSFKKAIGRLVYLPIAALIILLAIPVGKAAEAKWNRVNVGAENIAYVTMPDPVIENGQMNPFYVITSSVFGGTRSVNRGSTGAEKVRFTDQKLIASASKLLENKRNDGESPYFIGIFSLLEDLFESDYYSKMDVTLKDGSTWTVSTAALDFDSDIISYLVKNDEYMERVTGTERFGRAKVMSPFWLDREFADALLREINSLPASERLTIFKNSSNSSFYYGDTGMEETDSVARIMISSPTYDHTVYLNLNSKLPESLALYMKKANEHAAGGGADEIIARLASGDFNDAYMSITLIDGINVHKYESVGITMDEDMEAEYKAYARKLSATLADNLKKGLSSEGSRYILGVQFNSFNINEDQKDYRYKDLAGIDHPIMFVSIDEATYNELFGDLFGGLEPDPWNGWEEPIYY